MAFIVGGTVADHGLQNWAEGYSNFFKFGPVVAQAFLLYDDGSFDPSLTVPPGLDGQIIRLADGARAGSSTGGFPIVGSGWAAMSGGGDAAGGFGLDFQFTLTNVGLGSSFSFFPDGRAVKPAIPTDAAGVILAMVFCPASSGAGAGWKVIRPSRPLGQWNLSFPAFTVSSLCGGGGGGGGGGGTAPGVPSGVDVLAWCTGYHVAQAGSTGVHVAGRWHPDLTGIVVIPGAQVDSQPSCWEPRLSHPEHGPPLSVIYRGGDANDVGGAIFRAESYDFGVTWLPNPAKGQPFLTGPNKLKHATDIWNGRTGERVTVYNDQSQLDSKGVPTGKGAIKAIVYGPDIDGGTGFLRKVDTFPVTEIGVLGDDSSFGGIWIGELSAMDVVVMIGGNASTYRSIDDGRTWQRVQ